MPMDGKSNEDQAAKDLDDAHRHADPNRRSGSADKGEDEGAAAKEGSEDHLKEDQKTEIG